MEGKAQMTPKTERENEMNYFDAILKAKVEAQKTKRLCFVYNNPDGIEVSSAYHQDWYAKVFPGGRVLFSLDGMSLWQREKAKE
jgi:hypothetical protein